MNRNAITPIKGQAPMIYMFDDFPFRVIMRKGEPWFVAADMCSILGLGNVSQAIGRLDEDEFTLISNEGSTDEKGVASIYTLGGRPINIVSEPGLYSLVLGSRKPEAKRFKRWVTHEVLPSIRKTGQYAVPQRSSEYKGRVLITRELELQVFQLYLQGHRQAEIRQMLRISPGTVSELLRGRYSFAPAAGQDLTTPELRVAVARKCVAEQQQRFMTQLSGLCISSTNRSMADELDRQASEVLASLPVHQLTAP